MAEGQLLGVTRLALRSRLHPGWAGSWRPVSSPPAPVSSLEKGKDCHPECLMHWADFHPSEGVLSASFLRLLRARSHTRDLPSLGCQSPAAVWDMGAPLHSLFVLKAFSGQVSPRSLGAGPFYIHTHSCCFSYMQLS